MRRLVADAGVIADWFTAASALRADYEAGLLALVEPRSVAADLVAEIGARDALDADTLARIGDEVDRLGFELRDPAARDVGRWIARGLDARRATYAAVAEGQDLILVTDDEELRRVAAPRAIPVRDA